MVCVSVPFTKLHEHAYTILLLLWWYKCVLSTNKLWELNLLQGMHSMAQLSFVRKSLFISELHEHAYSHCSLLWYEMGVFYLQFTRLLVSYHYSIPVYKV